MTWNTPTDVSTGNALTALLWNNQLGANGSLQYLYNNGIGNYQSLMINRNASQAIAANSSYTILFDTTILNNGFTTTITPASYVQPLLTGYYAYAFVYVFSVNTQVYYRMIQATGAVQLASHVITTSSNVGYNAFSGITYLTSLNSFTCSVAITTASTLNLCQLILARISS